MIRLPPSLTRSATPFPYTTLFRSPAADVIDVPFALKPDRMAVYSPIDKCRNAIGLAIAMETYASNFFQGGGVPPLAVTGPLPKGPEALKRAMGDIGRAIDAARSSSKIGRAHV